MGYTCSIKLFGADIPLDSMELEKRPDLAGSKPLAGGMPLPRELTVFWICSLAAFALTVVVGWLKFRAGQSVYNWNPLSDPLFGDLDEYYGTYTLLHSSAFFFNLAGRPWPYPMFGAVAYPPLAAVVMAPLYAFPIPALLFLIVAGVWLMALVWWARRQLIRIGIKTITAILLPVTLVSISFPVQRLVHQGNIELVLWIFATLGVLAFWYGYDDAAGILWGLAAALKLFPVILLILFLPRQRYRAFAVGVGTFVVSTALSLWWLGPSMGVAWSGSLRNVFGYQTMRVSEWTLRELVANHSIINLAKIFAAGGHFSMDKLILPYFGAGAVLMAIAFFGRLWKLPVANQLLAVTAFMVMFPPISYYHTLVHMYAPLAVLAWVAIRSQLAGIRVRGLLGTMLLLIPLFVPFSLLTYPTVILYCGLIQSLVLIAVFFCALEFPFSVPGEAELAGVGCCGI